MAIETISYSVAGEGWNSFHSFIPDWMIGLNSSLYTWKNGDLYKHDSNSNRNEYYGVTYPSTITPVFNQNPLENKIFKTIAISGNSPWKADIVTDFTSGIIEADYFKEKEGDWFSFIRRINNTVDLKSMSTQGLGTGGYAALTFTFTFNIPQSISIGDSIYASPDPTTTAIALVGIITSYTANTITVASAAYIPNPTGDFIVAVKDSTAESYGSRGSWMEVKLTNNNTTPVELFTISSDTIKSYP
jgi:hypothetical protein